MYIPIPYAPRKSWQEVVATRAELQRMGISIRYIIKFPMIFRRALIKRTIVRGAVDRVPVTARVRLPVPLPDSARCRQRRSAAGIENVPAFLNHTALDISTIS